MHICTNELFLPLDSYLILHLLQNVNEFVDRQIWTGFAAHSTSSLID